MMGTELNEMIKRLPPDRQREVNELAEKLIAEEMRLRASRKACDMTAEKSGNAQKLNGRNMKTSASAGA